MIPRPLLRADHASLILIECRAVGHPERRAAVNGKLPRRERGVLPHHFKRTGVVQHRSRPPRRMGHRERGIRDDDTVAGRRRLLPYIANIALVRHRKTRPVLDPQDIVLPIHADIER